MSKIFQKSLMILVVSIVSLSVTHVDSKPKEGSDVNFGVLGGSSMGEFDFPFVGAFFVRDMPDRSGLPSGVVQRRLKLNFRENDNGFWKISSNLKLKKKKDGELDKHAKKDVSSFGRYKALKADRKKNIYIIQLYEADKTTSKPGIDTRKEPIETKKKIGKLQFEVDCKNNGIMMTVLEVDSNQIDLVKGEKVFAYPGGFSSKEKNIKITKWTCGKDGSGPQPQIGPQKANLEIGEKDIIELDKADNDPEKNIAQMKNDELCPLARKLSQALCPKGN